MGASAHHKVLLHIAQSGPRHQLALTGGTFGDRNGEIARGGIPGVGGQSAIDTRIVTQDQFRHVRLHAKFERKGEVSAATGLQPRLSRWHARQQRLQPALDQATKRHRHRTGHAHLV